MIVHHPPDDWPWPHFSFDEMKCKGNGTIDMTDAFRLLMDRLEAVRRDFGRPINVTSGYRSPEHNRKVSNTGYDGPHTLAAVDIKCSGGATHRLLELAIKHGFTGIGVSQKGNHAARFLHLDMLTPTARRPRPAVWSY